MPEGVASRRTGPYGSDLPDKYLPSACRDGRDDTATLPCGLERRAHGPHLVRLCEWTNSPAGFSRPWPMPSPWPSGATTSSWSRRTCSPRCSTSRTARTRPLLVKAGANVAKLRKDLDAALDKLPTVQGTPGDVHVSQDLNRLLNVTDKLAQQRKDDYIPTRAVRAGLVRGPAHARQTTQGRRRRRRPPSRRPSSRCAVARP